MSNKIHKTGTLLLCVLAFLSTNGQTRDLQVSPTSSGVSNWCWADAITMISTYYGNNPSICSIAEWTRINIPSTGLGNTDCCTIPTPTVCNKGITDDDIHTVLHNSQGIDSDLKDVLSLSSIYYVINNNRPLILLCSNQGGGGHVMVLYGYSTISSNDAMINYVDNGQYYSTLHSSAISQFSLGQYYSMWTLGSIVPTTQVCPANLLLHNTIGANASIKAQVNITIDGIINNNSTVSLTAGSNIVFNPGFEIQSGSTLTVTVSSNPCQ